MCKTETKEALVILNEVRRRNYAMERNPQFTALFIRSFDKVLE
ncbi:hypothetical protein LEP1GSC197_3486 [Leptospira interrogans serovar Pomona str. CSL4002]|nr:hypothetical protein [Leptospira interrogans]EMJ62216.1 hypothetical protein LEP1GSC197_3486 [Leptospira interrogans serovar Pomona str. CSL4002]